MSFFKMYISVGFGIILAAFAVASDQSPSLGEAEQEPHQISVEFVGRILDVGLPQEPIKVIPVDYDPRFALDVEILEILTGSLPWLEQNPSDQGSRAHIVFMIHSPTIFFYVNLRERPSEGAGFPEGPHLFTLVGDQLENGRWRYDLSMRALDTPETAEKNE